MNYRIESGTYPDNPSPLGTELVRSIPHPTWVPVRFTVDANFVDAYAQPRSYILLAQARTGTTVDARHHGNKILAGLINVAGYRLRSP